MHWPRESTHEGGPIADRLRTVIVLVALGLLVAIGDPGQMLAALFAPQPVTAFPEYANAFLPTYSPFTRGLAASVAPLLAVAILFTLLAARFAGRIAPAATSPEAPIEPLATGERGVSAIETMLLLPTLLVILLTIFQIALVVQAKFVVNYAAFCAVRAAIVFIPTKEAAPEDAENAIKRSDPDSPKMTKIRHAAAFACIAVSPRFSSSLEQTTVQSNLQDYSLLAPLTAVRFMLDSSDPAVTATFVERAHYAYFPENTKIEIVMPDGSDPSTKTFTSHEPITVRVTHRYFVVTPVVVPFIGRLLGTSFPGGGAFIPIAEQYTLLNEGDRLYPPGQEP
jgi:Flp pilus assembly protein TadG